MVKTLHNGHSREANPDTCHRDLTSTAPKGENKTIKWFFCPAPTKIQNASFGLTGPDVTSNLVSKP